MNGRQKKPKLIRKLPRFTTNSGPTVQSFQAVRLVTDTFVPLQWHSNANFGKTIVSTHADSAAKFASEILTDFRHPVHFTVYNCIAASWTRRRSDSFGIVGVSKTRAQNHEPQMMLSVSGPSEQHLMPLLSPSSALLQLELYAGQQLLEHTLVDKVQAGVDLICTASKLFEAPAHEKQNLIVCQTELPQDHNAVPLLLQTSEPTLHSVSKVLSKGIIPAVVHPVSSIEGSALAVMMDRGRRRSHRMDLVLTNVVLKLYSLREENEIILANLENSIRLLLQLNSTLSVTESDAGRVVQGGNIAISSVEASLTSEALPNNLLEGSTRQKYRQQTTYTKRDLKENGTPFCRPNDSIIQTTKECTTKMTIPCAEKGEVHEYNSDYFSSPCSTCDPLDSYLDRGVSLTSDTLAGILNDHSFPESN